MPKKIFIKPIIVGVILFFLSLIVDVIMGNPVNYGFAFMIAIFFAVVFYIFQYFLSQRKRKR